MRALSFILLIFFIFLNTGEVFANSGAYIDKIEVDHAFSKYRTQSGDSLAEILYRAGLSPLWGDDGYVAKTVELNTKNKFLQNAHAIKADIEIWLPIDHLDPNYSYDDDGYILLPFQPKAKRSVASVEKKIEKVEFNFSCLQDTNPEVYKKINEFILDNNRKLDEFNVNFLCNEDKRVSPYAVFPWLPKPEAELETKKEEQNRFLFINFGRGDVSYKEGAGFQTSYTETFINFKYRNLIPETDWYWDASVNMTLNTSGVDVAATNPRFVDVDVRVGRLLSVLPEPWALSIYGGLYYTQMFVSQDSYGYKGTYYPQIYPELRRAFKSGDALTFHLKYVPTANDFFTFESDKRAVELGATYYYRNNNMPLHFGFQYIDFQFLSEENNRAVELKRFNFTIGTGF